MNKSVLGADLEAEREKAFMARFGRILSQKEKLSQGDADYIRSLTRRLAATGGGFSPSIAQSTWLTDIDARLSALVALVAPRALISGPDLEKLIEAARGIIQARSLTPFRLAFLSLIVDKYDAEEPLSRNDLDMLQFLVLEGSGYPED